VRPFTRFASWLAEAFDHGAIDGMVNALAGVVWDTGFRCGRLQSGYVQQYLFVFLLGTLIILGYYALG